MGRRPTCSKAPSEPQVFRSREAFTTGPAGHSALGREGTERGVRDTLATASRRLPPCRNLIRYVVSGPPSRAASRLNRGVQASSRRAALIPQQWNGSMHTSAQQSVFPRRRRPGARGSALALTVLLSAGVLTTACGADGDDASAATAPPSRALNAAESPSSSGTGEPSASAEGSSPTPQTAEQRAQEEAGRERAAAAPSGVPVTPGEPKENKHFRHPVTTQGDVTVFKPVRSGSALTVPILVTNRGDQRAFYEVAVRITGDHGFDTTVRMKSEAVGLYPGTSWPAELTARDPGSPVPDNPQVTIVKSTKSKHTR